jgi:hypothetical protein
VSSGRTPSVFLLRHFVGARLQVVAVPQDSAGIWFSFNTELPEKARFYLLSCCSLYADAGATDLTWFTSTVFRLAVREILGTTW